MEDHEPLNADVWFARIDMIARGELRSTENALRHAFHLLQLTPREFRPQEYGSLNEAEYEELLEAGDLEAAARRLVAAPTLTVATAAGANGVDAAIRCSRLRRTVMGAGDSAAAAILNAWAKCLLTIRAELGTDHFMDAMGK